ncbi:MAG: CpaF family protein [Betaproteobacteria bacterium]|jgi:pilus assembly protein CpaF|nr:CpaF family protein [Betaproteobacteria bacterium]NBT11007.1 CpaF family protein [Betaproteobacteria bacterium]NBU50378.1 CpaF family protein [Betaproteobacteria bacterium]NBX95215.1 CpaF family protein [Betaproteobacteria bacterium]
MNYPELRRQLYQRVIDRVDLGALRNLDATQLRGELRRLTQRLLDDSNLPFNAQERLQVVADIEHEVMGLGPLEPLLQDDEVSDIMVNGAAQVWVERQGRLQPAPVRFDDEPHLRRTIDRVVARVGRRVDDQSPMVDARLPDGSRLNAIIPPLALDGSAVSIRKFSRQALTLARLVEMGSITAEMGLLLQALVRAKLNVLISGGTGTGKTTLLNILSAAIPPQERVVTIEDAAELRLQQPHVVRLETRPANTEGAGEVSQRALVRNALRMRPDRIILGEVRGAEAFDMLQAMNTGHEGSMATVHANNARDALLRVENMVGMGPTGLNSRVARQLIASALSVVLQLQRLADGSRRLVSISEVTGLEGDAILMQDLQVFDATGVDAQGRVQGHFTATGIRPQLEHRLRAVGIQLPDSLFQRGRRLSDARTNE